MNFYYHTSLNKLAVVCAALGSFTACAISHMEALGTGTSIRQLLFPQPTDKKHGQADPEQRGLVSNRDPVPYQPYRHG